MKIIFTTNFNKYDSIKDPIEVNENCQYICFTDDKNFKSKIWHPYYVEETTASHLLARKIFINSIEYLSKIEPNFTESLMIGGQIQILKKIDWNMLGNSDISIKKHPARNCLFDEAVEVLGMKKALLKDVLPQMTGYMKEGMPKNFGLWETGIMFRKNNEKVKIFEEAWWKEISTKSHRDQLSFPYITWKNPTVNIKTLDSKILSKNNDSNFQIFCHNFQNEFSTP